MATTTRPAVSADASDLHELAARTFGLATPPGTLQTDIDAFIEEHLALSSFDKYLADPARSLLLAEEDGATIGYSMLVAGPIADPALACTVAAAGPGPAIELSKFYVAPDSHGSGVAGTLMAATLAAAAATGARQCWLGVNQQNARAVRFYTRNGFEIVGTKRFLVGEIWHDDYVLARPL
ncbi:GNAT family N-acetyltransferase [Amorphoplanes digitatis]|uniref:Ribosomal protein S18 acetylase RimI-like enzyme n=1 Tax=Actinoplanes digitatis TaxID=1868 RepID=A0A7W7MTS5_9ACTN|nr:GNAT family N-acetyltransferase [Actinoplanes digitatis]MBB4766100.1 ribosomal protein S18 acetylase RimI-like enzyme [Actinoplanes digitatis]BFE76094.1 GNAT family N-acetyltransferase [Actinoplanes digitatis]GID98477.1 N-acetyltransferase [Actinoplanes digitatis]